MKKIIFFVIASILMFSSLSFVLAEDTTVTPSDLNVAEPTVLPNSPFYFLKELGRSVQLLITLDPVKKAEAKLKITSEKLVEAEKLSNNKEALSNALSNYTNSLNDLKNYSSTLKQDSESSTALLKKVAVQTFNQQKVLDQIAEKQTDSSQKIFESKEKAIDSLTNTSLALGSADKVKEALQEANDTTRSGTTNVIEVLKKVESIVPEKAKQSIIEAQNKIIEKRLGNTNTTEEDKTKLNSYLEELKTKTEYKDLMSKEYIQNLVNQNPDLFNSLGNISEEDKAKIIEYGKSILNGNITDYKEILNGFNSLGISSDAKKIVDNIQSQVENRYSEGGINCISVANPVCGKDNKNYNNVCEAKKAGVDVAYKGVCGSCITEGKAITTGKECCPGLKICPITKNTPTVTALTNNICQKSCGETSSGNDTGNTSCTTDWNPVCGENGKTYSNECFIKKAGIKIKYKGECNKDVKDSTTSSANTSTGTNPTTGTTIKVGLANPASKFCVDQGYKLEMKTAADGSQSGICVLSDKVQCEEWAFYRKECGKEYIK